MTSGNRQPTAEQTAEQTIEQAVRYLQRQGDAPATQSLVDALAAIEKRTKKERLNYEYAQFIGAWKLGFVSGTRKVRPSPKATPVKKLGKGNFLPRLIDITIAYTEPADSTHSDIGTVENAVKIGPLNLQLTGPTRFWPKTNSLAFDFTAISARIGGLPLYKGTLRGGPERDQTFKTQSIKDQAFFTFFIVESDYIAARGKGGGLALWTRRL